MTTFMLQELGNTTAVFTTQPSKANEEIKKMLAQDLTPNNLTETPEEKEAMDTISTTIQGVTGAQYTPMDTSPQAQQNQQAIEQLLNNLTYTIQAIIKLSVEKYKQPVSTPPAEQTNLQDTVETVLDNAEWFKYMVEERASEAASNYLEDKNFDYAIESAVGNYFDDFSLEDHVDVADLVNDAVEDRLSDIVDERLEDMVNEKMEAMIKTATITFN